jgi:hypothetical protein
MNRKASKSILVGAAAASIVMLSHGALAQATRTPPKTVAGLAEVCATPTSSPDYTAASFFCRGILAGAGQYHAALHPAGSQSRSCPLFCLPEPPPRLVDVAAAFVR